MPKRRQLRSFDLKQITGYAELIGVDEVGRGALAGPVVAAAVLVTKEFLEGRWAVTRAGRVNDSKLLSAAERERLWEDFEQLRERGEIKLHVGAATTLEIEDLNILGATKLAMRRALEAIHLPAAFVQQAEPDLFSPPEVIEAFVPAVSCRVLIDGLRLRGFPYPHDGLVRGDARSLAIAMASIAAKVTRDRMMVALEATHPGYGFAEHKGYGTPEHRDAVLRIGPCREHRRMFLRRLLNGRPDPAQMDMFAEGEEAAGEARGEGETEAGPEIAAGRG